jgi:hypothetical protein
MMSHKFPVLQDLVPEWLKEPFLHINGFFARNLAAFLYNRYGQWEDFTYSCHIEMELFKMPTIIVCFTRCFSNCHLNMKFSKISVFTMNSVTGSVSQIGDLTKSTLHHDMYVLSWPVKANW